MELPEIQPTPLCIDRFPDLHQGQDQLPWKSTPYSEAAPRSFSATGAGGMDIMQKIVPQGRDRVSELEQPEGKNVVVARGVTP